MSLMNKGDMKKGLSGGTKLLNDFIAPAIGGVAGFLSGDSFLGVRALVRSIVNSSGISTALPILSSLDISSFIAAGVYAGLGAVVSGLKFGGSIIGALFTAASWYFYAAACRLMLNGILSGITNVKSNMGG